MIGEIWTYFASLPSNGKQKVRPVLIIGDDGNNQLHFVDLHYVIISASADCGLYDVELEEETALAIGLSHRSVIKTIKIYTGPRTKMGQKIGELPVSKKEEFIKKYTAYQQNIISENAPKFC